MSKQAVQFNHFANGMYHEFERQLLCNVCTLLSEIAIWEQFKESILEIGTLHTDQQVWPVSYDKWKAPQVSSLQQSVTVQIV